MPEVMSIEVDEEFDPRPPSTPFGLRGPDGNLNFGLIAGVAIAIVLVLMLIFVVVKPFGGGDKAPAVPAWKPNDPAESAKFLETYPATSPMASSIQNSLEAWAKYYTTGDLRDLEDSFDLTGNQYALLVAEQAAVKAEVEAAGEPGEPAIIKLGPIGKVKRKDDIFTVRVVIDWTKRGALERQIFKWDIDMKSDDNLFVLSTTRNTDADVKLQPVNFCGAVDIIAQLDDDATLVKKTAKSTPENKLTSYVALVNARLKAWKILETAVDGTDSEADVAVIVERYQAFVDAGKKATTVEEIDEAEPETDSTDAEAAIESRASEECSDADITNR